MVKNQLHTFACTLIALLGSLLFPIQICAQDVTATWDFKNKTPVEAGQVALQGNTGEVPSNIEGISLFVDATNGKFNSADRTGDAQVNAGTIIRVPV